MATEAFARYPLGEALRDKLAGRKVLAALFTTYAFDPAFFQLHVVPLLFARGFSKEDAVRMVQLDEELLSTPVAVYFDRGAVHAGRGGGSLGIHAFNVRRATAAGATKGCFHPKVCLALVDDGDGDEALVICVSSANLTEAGHWTNVECAWIDQIAGGAECSYADDLLGVLKGIHEEARAFDTKHDALQRIQKFARGLRQSTQPPNGYLRPRLFYGQAPFAEFLDGLLQLRPDTYHLEVISPFFDDGAALRELHGALGPKSTRVYLPVRDDGAATCEKAYFDVVRVLPGASWGKFVDAAYLRRSTKRPDEERRTVHAKVYRLWSRATEREFVVVGSVNLTSAAHTAKRAGNFEVAVVLESREPVLRSFLEPLEQDPSEFGAGGELDDEKQRTEEPCPLILRFHWGPRRLEAFWDASLPSSGLSLTIAGVRLGTEVPPLSSNTWIDLPPPLANELAEHLPRTSLVQVQLPETEPSWVVVNEEDLAHKPSLLLHLTVEEILRYWSALSDAQRQALLERADVRRAQGRPALAALSTQDSMFDRFAGVFHAFERLREHIEKAIAEKRPHDAVYRLFGAKHDSLPALLDRVLQEEEVANGDATDATTRLAVRYATLLSARRLLRQLQGSNANDAFLVEHGDDVKRLLAKLDTGDTLRKRVAAECGDQGDAFLAWFDDWFLGKRDRGEE